MEEIKQFQQTIETDNINEKIKEFISQNYLFTDERVYKLTKPKTTRIGEIFEVMFRTLVENEGLIEGKDFLDLRNLRHRCIGVPDFFFIKANTFVEIKSNCTANGKVFLLDTQHEKIKKLKEQGFDIKTLFFDIKILEDDMTLYSLLKRLVG